MQRSTQPCALLPKRGAIRLFRYSFLILVLLAQTEVPQEELLGDLAGIQIFPGKNLDFLTPCCCRPQVPLEELLDDLAGLNLTEADETAAAAAAGHSAADDNAAASEAADAGGDDMEQ